MVRNERNAPRKLVRWDNEMDMLCFLAIPRVMARRGIKFPWGEVAAYVGEHVSGNALLQHMAKETKKRGEMGQAIPEAQEPVGNPANFGMMAAAGFGDRRNAQLLRAMAEVTNVSGDDNVSQVAKPPARNSKPRVRTKQPLRSVKATPKPRKKAVPIKPEVDSDESDGSSSSFGQDTSRGSNSQSPLKRAREANDDDDNDDDAAYEHHQLAPFAGSPKKIKLEARGAESDSDSNIGLHVDGSSRITTLHFAQKLAQYRDLASTWEDEDIQRSPIDHKFNNDFDFAASGMAAPTGTGHLIDNDGFMTTQAPLNFGAAVEYPGTSANNQFGPGMAYPFEHSRNLFQHNTSSSHLDADHAIASEGLSASADLDIHAELDFGIQEPMFHSQNAYQESGEGFLYGELGNSFHYG